MEKKTWVNPVVLEVSEVSFAESTPLSSSDPKVSPPPP
jgi:hypothetical protein